ncbi:interleukin-17 receptor C isoform X2 [Hippocampus comes]|uniref:interleukin-17 receptor C isoform X2 n=1 Tax=Hippocampus comes TaxID=109280 RepID=UPI00094EAB71|nr:PREDICTED: interleukin-17 receptor C-like isoform X2 [Hippocampus comes]
MFLLRWPFCCFLLAFHKPACGWVRHDVSEVTCSQGLSECTVVAVMPFAIPESDAVDIQTITAKVELCCKENTSCTLCLLMEAEIAIHVDEDMAKKLQSKQDTEEDTQAATISAAFVTLCYNTPPTFPACKRVDFTVTPTGLEQKVAKISLVITNPSAVSFSSIVYVYSSKAMHPRKEVVSPSLNEVCSQNRRKPIKECHVPTISSVINQKMNQVELKFSGESNVCIQYEADGRCQSWERKTIPLHSVTPCLCLQVWDDDRRSQSCPFKNMGFLQENVWRNLTASVDRGRMNDKGQMLLWNLTAPCRLEGEVWPCRWTLPYICTEIEGFRQQLGNSTWKQNRSMLWVKKGVFEDINLQLSTCVMVRLRNGGLHLGPFCSHQTARWRWNLLAVAVLLVITLTALILCLLHDFIKKWASRSFRGGCTKIGSKGHVVLLSPPDVHNDISEVCGLGSRLSSQGFSVSVDQWSRMEQCNLGPLPWLHSQLLHVKNLGGRAVLILTRKTMGLVQEWSQQHREALRAGSGDGNAPQSPYSDVFMASLSLILGDKQQGRTGERFLLVTFEQDVAQSAGSLPEPFQGLHLFQLPSQMKTLLCELTGGAKGKAEGGRIKAGWKWATLDGWKSKTKNATCSQGTIHVQCKYSGI